MGIDIGSTHCKVGIYNEDGELVKFNKTKTQSYSNKDWTWYDAEEIWAEIAQLIHKILDNINPKEIAGLSVASIGESGIPVDKNGLPTYHVIAWFDHRSLPQSRKLEEVVGKEKIFKITGMDNNSIFSLSKIMWLKENKPEVFKKTVKWLSMTDYINYKLTGQIATNYSIASRTLALDIKKNTWSDELLKIVGLDKDLFPPLKPSLLRFLCFRIIIGRSFT